MSRRSLLRRGRALALTGGAAAALSGCENTTTPVAASGGPTSGKGILGDPTAGGPVDSAGIPLARKDYPVVMPKLGDVVSSAAKPERGGELHIYNYADYLNPEVLKAFGKQENVSVRVTTFDTLDEAFSKLSAGRLEFDVIFSTPDQLSRLVGRRLLQPLNYELIPNLEKNIWPELADPFYDRGGRYTVPYVVWMDGIGWRNDKVKEDVADMDVPWDIFWKAQAYRGRVGILDDRRDALSMPMQRDGMRRGVRPDLNTEEEAVVVKAEKDLSELGAICNPKVTITDYQTLPEGKTVLHHSWSGDILGGAFYYMPKNVPPSVLSFWGPDENGVVQNDYFCVGKSAKSPALAHQFINFFLDEKNAYDNFVNFTGYTPPQKNIDADALLKRDLIPKSLEKAVVRPEQFAANQELLQLSVEGQRHWDDAWSRFKVG